MKKIGIIVLAAIPCFSGYAQSGKVVSAYRYLQDYNSSKDVESLNKAKEAIDLATVNPSTMDMAKTQVYRGQIYLALYDDTKRKEEDKLSNIADPNKRAIAAIQNTPVTDLETAYQAFVKAKTLDTKGNYATELKAVSNIGIYYNNAGRVDFNIKKYPEALTAFERTYEISGNTDTTALNNAALSAERMENYDKAKTYYQKMIDNKQGGPTAYASLKDVYLMSKDTVGGMDVLKKGRAAYPNDVNLLISETNFFLKTNNSKEALHNLDQAIQAKPGDASLFLARGNIYDNLANPKDAKGNDMDKPKDYSEKIVLAEADYKKALDLKPGYFDALFNLGALYNNEGVALNKQAEEIIDNAKNAAQNKKATEAFSKAMPILEQALAVNPKDRNTMFALKQIYARLQLTDKYNDMKEKLKN